MVAPLTRLNDVGKLKRAPFYSLRARTGAITAVAAATSSAGHLIGMRNAGAQGELHVMRMAMRFLATVDPSTEQAVGFQVHKCTAFTALHTGGTGAANQVPVSRAEADAQNPAYSAITAITARVAGTDALTAGTQTIAEALGFIDDFALADAATVKHTKFGYQWKSPDKHPLFILGTDEGLVVRNTVLMANSLAGHLIFELDGWLRDTPTA